MFFKFLLCFSIFSDINGAFLIVHSIMQWSDRNSNLVRLWIQLSSSLWIIQSKVLPALCIGNSISCVKLNVYNISFILLVSICSKRFHGILKSPVIIGWEFSFSSNVKNSLNSSKKLRFSVDSSLSKVVCKSRQIVCWNLMTSPSKDFSDIDFKSCFVDGHQSSLFSAQAFVWNYGISCIFGLWCCYFSIYFIIDPSLCDEAYVYFINFHML